MSYRQPNIEEKIGLMFLGLGAFVGGGFIAVLCWYIGNQ